MTQTQTPRQQATHLPLCVQGAPTLRTLQSELHTLIERHSLPEVFDRLTQLTFNQQEICEQHNPNGHEVHQEWCKLVQMLEEATEQALTIATLLERSNQQVWR